MHYSAVQILRQALWFSLLSVPVAAQLGTLPGPTVYGSLETRDYWSENGRHIRITSLGNLAGFESPLGFEHINNRRRAREGYVVAYNDSAKGVVRVLFDVHDVHSAVLGARDLVPYSFTAPLSGTVFPVAALVSATIVVDTADGLLRLTHQIDWQAGLGTVTLTTTVTNRSSASLALASFKRHADIYLDGAGGLGAATANDVIRVVDGFAASISCYCAPHPGPPPLTPVTVSQHAMKLLGIPSPAHKMIHSDADNSELYLAGPSLSSDLPGVRRSENDQLTIVWPGSALPAGGSRSFTAQYQQQ